jgi:hypothetical protein
MINESVTLKLEIKNVPELHVKVFEFNTETYYKKELKPFDTSIDLHGMVPAISKSFKYSQARNKIHDEIFEFEELKGKVGLFIIEFMGNGLMSRAVVKKGML